MRDWARASLGSGTGIGFRLLLPLVFGIALSGCSMLRSTFADEKGEIVYAASADLPVRATPFATSKAIGRLALHEQVTRTKVERGFAHIVATRGGVKGWVDNSQLLLPGTGAVEKPAAKEAEKPAEDR